MIMTIGLYLQTCKQEPVKLACTTFTALSTYSWRNSRVYFVVSKMSVT